MKFLLGIWELVMQAMNDRDAIPLVEEVAKRLKEYLEVKPVAGQCLAVGLGGVQ